MLNEFVGYTYVEIDGKDNLYINIYIYVSHKEYMDV